MLYEFAIEPSVLNCWARYDSFMADCGVATGRLVSEFPVHHWKHRVWDAVLNNPARTAMDEQKVQYHLQHTAESKLVYTGRTYHFQQNAPIWLDQALREHAARAFQAIVSSSPVAGSTRVIHAQDFDKHDCAAWAIEPSYPTARTPQAIAALTELLCRGATRVTIIDPYFNPEQPRFQKSFRSMFETIFQIGAPRLKVEVHSGIVLDCQNFVGTLANHWPQFIPPGRKVSFFRWKEEPQGEQLHRRMILADRGGILVEAGLDCGQAGQTTTVTRLSAAEHLRFWKGLQAPSTTEPSPDSLYEFHDTCDATGTVATAPNRPYRR